MNSYAGNRFSGTSLETKPLNVPDGAIFDELDTLYQYLLVNGVWVRQIGFSGYSGFSGQTGVGTSGFSGYSGISGFSGQTGGTGQSGFSGFSGFSGLSGFSGFSGQSGHSGFSGYSGFSGQAGIGTSGFSGYSGQGSIITIHQEDHGFSVLQVVRATNVENVFTLAQADTADNADMVGVVYEVIDPDTFNLMFDGEITHSNVPNYPVGTYVFLSSTTAGGLTDVEPSVEGEISMPVGVIMTPGSRILILHLRGVEIIYNIGTSGYSGYSGERGPQGISGYSGIAGSSLINEIDGGWAGSLYLIDENIDGGGI